MAKSSWYVAQTQADSPGDVWGDVLYEIPGKVLVKVPDQNPSPMSSGQPDFPGASTGQANPYADSSFPFSIIGPPAAYPARQAPTHPCCSRPLRCLVLSVFHHRATCCTSCLPSAHPLLLLEALAAKMAPRLTPPPSLAKTERGRRRPSRGSGRRSASRMQAREGAGGEGSGARCSASRMQPQNEEGGGGAVTRCSDRNRK